MHYKEKEDIAMKRDLKEFFSRIIVAALVIATTVCPVIATAESTVEVNEVQPRSTTYFKPYSEFTFTRSTVGGIFHVPKTCTGRLQIGFVATDGNGGTLTVKLKDTLGYTKHSFTIESGEAKLEIINNVTAGDYYFYYELNRDAGCWVGMSFYTWTY